MASIATNADVLRELTITTVFSPAPALAAAGLTITGFINMCKNGRGGLSKLFSGCAAAVGGGGFAAAAYILETARGLEGLAAPFVLLPAVVGAGLFNIAAHYTRDLRTQIYTVPDKDAQIADLQKRITELESRVKTDRSPEI